MCDVCRFIEENFPTAIHYVSSGSVFNKDLSLDLLRQKGQKFRVISGARISSELGVISTLDVSG